MSGFGKYYTTGTRPPYPLDNDSPEPAERALDIQGKHACIRQPQQLQTLQGTEDGTYSNCFGKIKNSRYAMLNKSFCTSDRKVASMPVKLVGTNKIICIDTLK